MAKFIKEPETWLPVPHFENLYEVSNHGNVRSLDRLVWNAHNKSYSRLKGKILKLGYNTHGYQHVQLYKDGKPTCVRINRLVAILFVANPKNLLEVGHNDDVRSNNYFKNLYWTTRQENMARTRIPIFQYTLDNIFIKSFHSYTEAMNAGFTHVHSVCSGKRKSCNGYKFSKIKLH